MESHVRLAVLDAEVCEHDGAKSEPLSNAARGSVIGLGNVLLGDFGAGLHVIDALSQEPLGPNVALAPLGEEYQQLIHPLLDVEVAVIIKGVCLCGVPGEIHLWDLPEFRRQASLDTEVPSRLRTLAEWLERIEIGCGLPRLYFVFVEVEETSGAVLSTAVRRALRKMVGMTLSLLREQGAIQPEAEGIARIYSLSCLKMTV